MKRGFALVQWMICSAIMILLSMNIYRFIYVWHQQLSRMHALCNKQLPIYVALDMLRHDCTRATTITCNSADSCTLHWKYHMITWQAKEGNLVRQASHYDTKAERWKRKTGSLLAQDIDRVVITPLIAKMINGQARQIGITMQIKQGSTVIEQIGYMRNGTYTYHT